MSLKPINFGAEKMTGGSILIHGANNTGKTVLLAASLKYFSKEGKVTMASFAEEQGHSSAAGMGLEAEVLGYQCLYYVDTIDDFIEWLTMIEKSGDYIATGVDSLWALYRAIQRKKTGGNRPPVSGTSDNNEWPWIHNDAHNIMTRWRQCAAWNIMTCPSDTGQNILKSVESGGLVKQVKVCPDLNGRMAEGCIHWFNLVGYLMCDTVKQGKQTSVIRTLSFSPSQTYLTRQRMPLGGKITEMIDIPDGDPFKGWETLMNLIQDAYRKAHKKGE
jgi:hypothetical protein